MSKLQSVKKSLGYMFNFFPSKTAPTDQLPLKASTRRKVARAGAGEGKEEDDVETQESKLSPRLTPATLRSQHVSSLPELPQSSKNVWTWNQIMGNDRSLADIAAELTLTRDAISRHRAQIRFSSREISHLESLEKELHAEIEKP
ncbi:hypothetical protein BD779DRAFT_1471216 [Infundibulicybe gibba]|nr:hypothetical protein BD779DRAFT_1471216 [Infundibulicybe gibba]